MSEYEKPCTEKLSSSNAIAMRALCLQRYDRVSADIARMQLAGVQLCFRRFPICGCRRLCIKWVWTVPNEFSSPFQWQLFLFSYYSRSKIFVYVPNSRHLREVLLFCYNSKKMQLKRIECSQKLIVMLLWVKERVRSGFNVLKMVISMSKTNMVVEEKKPSNLQKSLLRALKTGWNHHTRSLPNATDMP